MQTSGLKKFFKLYAKEMREIRPEIIVLLVATAVLDLCFYLKAGDLPVVVLFASFMVMGLAAFLPFISSFKLLGREWSSNTVYFLMSLPVKGGSILGAKLLALLSQYVIGTAAVIGGYILLALLLYPEPGALEALKRMFAAAQGVNIQVWQTINAGLLLYLLSIVGMAYAICISFFSQLLGKMVKRFSGLVTGIVFIATFWLMGKVMGAVWELVGTYGHFSASLLNSELVVVQQALGLSSLVSLVGVGLVLGAAILVYNHRIEL